MSIFRIAFDVARSRSIGHEMDQIATFLLFNYCERIFDAENERGEYISAGLEVYQILKCDCTMFGFINGNYFRPKSNAENKSAKSAS